MSFRNNKNWSDRDSNYRRGFDQAPWTKNPNNSTGGRRGYAHVGSSSGEIGGGRGGGSYSANWPRNFPDNYGRGGGVGEGRSGMNSSGTNPSNERFTKNQRGFQRKQRNKPYNNNNMWNRDRPATFYEDEYCDDDNFKEPMDKDGNTNPKSTAQKQHHNPFDVEPHIMNSILESTTIDSTTLNDSSNTESSSSFTKLDETKTLPSTSLPSSSKNSKELIAEEVTKKLINQLTSMDKHNLKQMINNPNIKYDTVLQAQARKKFREEMRKQLRHLSENPLLEPMAYGMDSEKMPETVMDEIERVLNINLLNDESQDLYLGAEKVLMENTFLLEERINESDFVVDLNPVVKPSSIDLKDDDDDDDDNERQLVDGKTLINDDNFMEILNADTSLPTLTNLSFLSEKLHSNVEPESMNLVVCENQFNSPDLNECLPQSSTATATMTINSINNNYDQHLIPKKLQQLCQTSESTEPNENIIETSEAEVSETCLNWETNINLTMLKQKAKMLIDKKTNVESNKRTNINDAVDNYTDIETVSNQIGNDLTTSTPYKKTKKSSRELLEEEIIRNPHKYAIKKPNPKKTVSEPSSHNSELDLQLDAENSTESIATEICIPKPKVINEPLSANTEEKQCEEPPPRPTIQEQLSFDSTDSVSSTSVKKPLDLLTKIKNFTAIKEAASSRNNEKLTLKLEKEKSVGEKKKKKCRRKKEKRKDRKYAQNAAAKSRSASPTSPTSASEYSQDSHKIQRSQSRNSFRYSDSENTGSRLEMDKSAEEMSTTTLKKCENPLFSYALSSIYNVCIERLQDLDANSRPIESNVESDTNESNPKEIQSQELTENVPPSQNVVLTQNNEFLLTENPSQNELVQNEELAQNEILAQNDILAQNEELTQNEEISNAQNKPLEIGEKTNDNANSPNHLKDVKAETVENENPEILEPCVNNENLVTFSECSEPSNEGAETNVNKESTQAGNCLESRSTVIAEESNQPDLPVKTEAEVKMEVDNLENEVSKENQPSATNLSEDNREIDPNGQNILTKVSGKSSIDPNSNKTAPDTSTPAEVNTQQSISTEILQESNESIVQITNKVESIPEQNDEPTKLLNVDSHNPKSTIDTSSQNELKRSHATEIENSTNLAKKVSSKKSKKDKPEKTGKEKSKKDGDRHNSNKHSETQKTKDKIDKTNRERSRSRENLPSTVTSEHMQTQQRLWRSPGEKKCIEPVPSNSLYAPVIEPLKQQSKSGDHHSKSRKTTAKDKNERSQSISRTAENEETPSTSGNVQFELSQATTSHSHISQNTVTNCSSPTSFPTTTYLNSMAGTSSQPAIIPGIDSVFFRMREVDFRLKQLENEKSEIDEMLLKLQKNKITIEKEATRLQNERFLLLLYARADAHLFSNNNLLMQVQLQQMLHSQMQSNNQQTTSMNNLHLVENQQPLLISSPRSIASHNVSAPSPVLILSQQHQHSPHFILNQHQSNQCGALNTNQPQQPLVVSVDHQSTSNQTLSDSQSQINQSLHLNSNQETTASVQPILKTEPIENRLLAEGEKPTKTHLKTTKHVSSSEKKQSTKNVQTTKDVPSVEQKKPSKQPWSVENKKSSKHQQPAKHPTSIENDRSAKHSLSLTESKKSISHRQTPQPHTKSTEKPETTTSETTLKIKPEQIEQQRISPVNVHTKTKETDLESTKKKTFEFVKRHSNKRILGICDVPDDLTALIRKKSMKKPKNDHPEKSSDVSIEDDDKSKIINFNDHNYADNDEGEESPKPTNKKRKKTFTFETLKKVKTIEKPREENSSLNTENDEQSKVQTISLPVDKNETISENEKSLKSSSEINDSILKSRSTSSKSGNTSSSSSFSSKQSRKSTKSTATFERITNESFSSEKIAKQIRAAFNLKECTVRLQHCNEEQLNFRGFELTPSKSMCESPLRNEMEFNGHKQPIVYLKVHGDYVLAASEDGNLYKYDLKTGKLIKTFFLHSKTITSFVLVGDFIYTVSLDGFLKKANHEDYTAVLFSIDLIEQLQIIEYDWETAFIGSRNGKIISFNTKADQINENFNCSLSKAIVALKTTTLNLENILLICSRANNINVRNAKTGNLLRTIEMPHKCIVSTIIVDNGNIYCGTNQNIILIYDLMSANEVERKPIEINAVCMKFYTNSIILCGNNDGYIYPYDIVHKVYLQRVYTSAKMLTYFEVFGENIIVSSKENKLLQILKLPDYITISGELQT